MKAICFVPLVILFVAGACETLVVPDFNAPSVDELTEGATRATVAIAAVGLLAGTRDFENSFLVSHTASLGEFGRESIELDPSNPQHPLDRLETPLGSNEPRYAGYATGFRMIRQGNVLLNALDGAEGLSDQEKEATRGFAKTLMAVSFIRLNNAFDDSGLPIDVDIPTDADPAPVVSNAEVKTHIIKLLEEGNTHLSSGGSAFPYPLTSGFADFTTVAAFRTFNRALRARMAVYVGDNTGALGFLSESFLDTGLPLTLGAYDTYSTQSGDRGNPLFDPTCRQLFSVPENETEAQLQPGGELDQRFLDKIRKIPPKEIHGMVVDSCFNVYPSASAPVPIIRNEELILLRAEANIGLGDLATALIDINFIRVNSGGLAPLGAFADATAALDELLYNKRYSLIYEGGHRWVDMRRYGRLAQLGRFLPQHVIYPYLPLATSECVSRATQPPGCTAPTPL